MLRPLEDRIVVKRLEAKGTTDGGIVIPDQAKKPSRKAKVIRVGKGRVLDNGVLVEPLVKEGDIVLMGTNPGVEIKSNGESYFIVREGAVLAVIEDE